MCSSDLSVSGYVADATDCDDTLAEVSPAAAETCNSRDDDCDGTTDEDSASDATTWYLDADDDGHGSTTSHAACTVPSGYVAVSDDCDDTDDAVNPDATEACNGIDDDCDGSIDEAGATGEVSWYADDDEDGYGDAAAEVVDCDAPAGFLADDTDCDDADPDIYPGSTEVQDLVDNDCDGLVDEDFVAVGDLVISEVARQPRFGQSSTVTYGQWFEVYNASAYDIDMSGWYINRHHTSTIGFYVDPASEVYVAAGDYAVFCNRDDYTAEIGRAHG